ncbi:MAG: hypothetical protein KA214_10655 [Neisseriaceae bacterium]|nr:hypothetical protein [Neisseriaceae bacterium]
MKNLSVGAGRWLCGAVLLLPLGLAHQAQAAARQYDGAAKAWVEQGQLCLGAEPDYEVDGQFASAAKVAEHQVMLSTIMVHKDNQIVWQAHAPNINAVTVRLQPKTCLPYGQTPPSMTEIIPAQPLREGLYTVMLVAADEQNRRAWFYQYFCVGPNVSHLRITPAQFDAKAWRWQCR